MVKKHKVDHALARLKKEMAKPRIAKSARKKGPKTNASRHKPPVN
jgi:ribosomal protein S21